jgi:hypothetical protein
MLRRARINASLLGDALLRRGWQHDGRQPMNPAKPGPRPQKVPDLS